MKHFSGLVSDHGTILLRSAHSHRSCSLPIDDRKSIYTRTKRIACVGVNDMHDLCGYSYVLHNTVTLTGACLHGVSTGLSNSFTPLYLKSSRQPGLRRCERRGLERMFCKWIILVMSICTSKKRYRSAYLMSSEGIC